MIDRENLPASARDTNDGDRSASRTNLTSDWSSSNAEDTPKEVGFMAFRFENLITLKSNKINQLNSSQVRRKKQHTALDRSTVARVFDDRAGISRGSGDKDSHRGNGKESKLGEHD